MTISLQDLQETLQKLWIDNDACEDSLDGHEADCLTDGDRRRLRRNIDRQGVELYRGLLRYGWHDVMSSIYPLCQDLLSDEWPCVVDRYLRIYPPKHFNLNRLAKHFSAYVASHEDVLLSRFPFITELADYEWIELEVLEHPGLVIRECHEAPSTVDEFRRFVPIVNPTLCIRRYKYPVKEIADVIERDGHTDCLPNKARETYLIAFRPAQSTACKIIDIGNLACIVLEAARARRRTYGQLAVCALSSCTDLPADEAALEFMDLVEKLHSLDVFIGQCVQ